MPKQPAKRQDQKTEAAPPDVEQHIDALFMLPLPEFTAERNALAAKLKRAGHAGDAARVKALAKPTVSAWAVNQLYWAHRDAFDRLSAASQGYRQAHAAQLAGKSADLRGKSEARRAAISELSRLAAALLGETGHHPSPETMRRITTTLEAISAGEQTSDDARPGRVTADLDPPGFEALAGLGPSTPATKPIQRAPQRDETRDREDGRNKRIAAAERSLQEAESALKNARAYAEKTDAALDEANKRAQLAAEEAEKAAQAVRRAERAVAEAVRSLDALRR